MYYVYINTHTCMYIFKNIFKKKNMLCLYVKCIYIKKLYKQYIYVLFINIYSYSIYLENIYNMCVRLYIHNKYTQYTHIMFTKTFMLDAIVIYSLPSTI